MNDIQSLKAIFDRYAGTEIKEPYQKIEEHDEVVAQLAQEVGQAGFIFGDSALQTKTRLGLFGCFPAPKHVQAEYEKSADGKTRLTGRFAAQL